MDYWDLSPEKVKIGSINAWRISWRDGRKARFATFRLQREALDFKYDLVSLDGEDPRLVPSSRWACDGEFTTVAPARGGALTLADLESIRVQGPRDRYDEMSYVRLVIFGMESGVETITLDTASQRIADGQHLTLLITLDDIPAAFLTAWAKSQPPAKPVAGYDGAPAYPVVKLHGESDNAEVNRILAEGYLVQDQYRSFSPATLRMIAVARGIGDLRHLPANSGEFNAYVDWQVVCSAVLTDLSVGMFMPGDMTDLKDRDWHWDGVSGLPAGPLADLQVYGSNLNGQWQGMSHTLGCQHRGRRQADRFTGDDQMMPLWQYVLISRDNRCSKCNGRSVRRPTALQLTYYKDMEALSDALKEVSIAVRGKRERFSHGMKDEQSAEITATLKRIEDTWCRRGYIDHLSLAEKKRLTDIIEETRKRVGNVDHQHAENGGSADVLRFPPGPR
jgi:hypothetical protein